MKKQTPEWAKDIPLLSKEAQRMSHHSLRGHGGIDGFRARLDKARARHGWLIPQRGSTLLDFLLAVAIGVGLAALLFYGLSA